MLQLSGSRVLAKCWTLTNCHCVVLILLFMIVGVHTQSTRHYYISNAGSDLNNGLSTSRPFATLAPMQTVLNNIANNPGSIARHFTISLCNGDFFTTQSLPGGTLQFNNIQGNPSIDYVTVSNYSCNAGRTSLPTIFSGFRLRQPWGPSPINSNFVSLNLGPLVAQNGLTQIHMLTLENPSFPSASRYFTARQPNLINFGVTQGVSRNEFYFAIRGKSNETFLQSDQLSGLYPDGYWNGATIRYRTNPWSYESRTVSQSYSSGGFALTQPLTAGMVSISQPDDLKGFFLEPHGTATAITYLDQPGEFYFDPSTGVITLYPFAGERSIFMSPASDVRIVTNQQVGQSILTVVGSSRYIRFSNLHLQYGGIGINHQTANVISIEYNNIELDHTIDRGIYGPFGANDGNSSPGFILSNSFLHHIDFDGVFARSASSRYTTNRVNDIGIAAGYALGQTGHCLYTQRGYIASNQINRCGYVGIRSNEDALVERNLVNNTVLTQDDGGGQIAADDSRTALYCWSAQPSGINWRWNRIDNTIGNGVASSADGVFAFAPAIYLDDQNGNTTAYGNIVTNSGTACAYSHNNNNNTVINNLCVSSGFYVQQNLNSLPVRNNRFINNFVIDFNVTTEKRTPFVVLRQDIPGMTIDTIVTLINNTYCLPTWPFPDQNADYPLFTTITPTTTTFYFQFLAWANSLAPGNHDRYACSVPRSILNSVQPQPVPSRVNEGIYGVITFPTDTALINNIISFGGVLEGQ